MTAEEDARDVASRANPPTAEAQALVDAYFDELIRRDDEAATAQGG